MKKVAFGVNCETKFMNMPSRHAEADVLNKIKHKKNLPRCVDIFVIRLSKSGTLGESRPCYHCLEMMEKSGLNIKYIYYSNYEGQIIREKFNFMKNNPSTYISSGVRKNFRG